MTWGRGGRKPGFRLALQMANMGHSHSAPFFWVQYVSIGPRWAMIQKMDRMLWITPLQKDALKMITASWTTKKQEWASLLESLSYPFISINTTTTTTRPKQLQSSKLLQQPHWQRSSTTTTYFTRIEANNIKTVPEGFLGCSWRSAFNIESCNPKCPHFCLWDLGASSEDVCAGPVRSMVNSTSIC